MQLTKRVEIIVSSLELEEILEMLDGLKFPGYTVIRDASGKGDRGEFTNDLGREFGNCYILTTCQDVTQLDQLVTLLRPILKRVGGLCLVSDAALVIH
ncbi:MAG: transcriptional regulator [Limnothrix sp. CACIAM 69d]|nr:MAG: transcriptional regulator [Limnothrix sp. CACIAM 69d]